MKNGISLFITLVVFTSCIDKNPEINEEDFKNQQIAYEAKKKETVASNLEFIKNNSLVLQERLKTIYKVQDSAYEFKGVSTDTAFFLDSKRLAVSSKWNFPSKNKNKSKKERSVSKSKILVVNKRNNSFEESRYEDPYTGLYSCMDNFEDLCDETDLVVMEELLSTHYIAVVEEMLRMEPSLEDSDNFNGGLFIGRISVYDVLNDQPLIQITSSATNSDELSYNKGGYLNESPRAVIKRDFNKNVYLSVEKALREHFTLENYRRSF